MKLYSKAYNDTLITALELKEAKTALVNLDGSKLHALIDSEAQKSAAKPINHVKAALGLKASTPTAIRALSDLYQTAHLQDPVGKPVFRSPVHSPWEAARRFASERADVLALSKSSEERLTSRQGSVVSMKSLQFSESSEEIPSGQWRLSAKKCTALVSPAVLASDEKFAYMAKAQKRHNAKRAAVVDDLKAFKQLKFVI